MTTALPSLSHNINLNGPGSDQLTVQRSQTSGTPDFRILTINSSTTVTVSGLTISNGSVSGGPPGGGVHNSGVLTVSNTTVSGNIARTAAAAGGIYNIGVLTLNNSTVSGNTADSGGGISNRATLVMAKSMVGGNTSKIGGGIYNNSPATMTLTNSTVSGNTSISSGGGGGIFNENGSLTLANVTVTGNTGNGVTGGGGLFNFGGTTYLRNTIVANNAVVGGGLGPDLKGTFNSQDYNLIGNTSDASFTGNVAHNILNVDAKLGPLANNGGPTMTHALLVGSPAINGGSNALAVDQDNNALTTDQRGSGFPRIFDGTVDIGAYEAGNPIDEASFFVRQHYLDFLNRQPDQSGLDFWVGNITSCGSDAQCVETKRINVSAAFFLSIEFQQTGNLVYKMYKAGFGNLTGKPVAVDRAPFIADTRQIQTTPAQIVVGQGDWQTQLETNKQAFALAFVQRPAFQSAHGGQDAATYVNSLFGNAGVAPTGTETSAAINAFNTAGGGDAGRASALRSVAESNSVSNKLFNEAFVLMQYFGYLQRNPYDPPEPTLDYQGYNFWLNKLNQFNGNYINAEMVKAFLASSEYQQRFGP
ncbi:MAG TPA: hypothetical protein DC054_16795 [Blastocatellia bacterium]|nr:hypothetical protein [Blastocatellia bacterium]